MRNNNLKYVNAVLALRPSVWTNMQEKEKLDTLQTIVDFYLGDIYPNGECRVELSPFNNHTTMARYQPDVNIIQMREEMILRGEVNTKNGKARAMIDPTSQIFFYLVHEIAHARQQHKLNNPHLYPDDAKIELYRCNQSCTGELNSYFKSESIADGPLADFAEYLYMLQPVECEAFQFAHEEVAAFTKAMHEFFPNECNVYPSIVYSNFEEIKNTARTALLSLDPEHDINNVLRTMNGLYVKEPLVEHICTIIKETQPAAMYKRIKEQESMNIVRVELEFKNNDHHVDVSDLFDDPQQDISDRR